MSEVTELLLGDTNLYQSSFQPVRDVVMFHDTSGCSNKQNLLYSP